MSGQSGRKCRSSRRRLVRKSDTLGIVEWSEVVLVDEAVEEVDVKRDVAWRGLLELAGGLDGLDRTSDALDELDAIPACLMSDSIGRYVKDVSEVGLKDACRCRGPFSFVCIVFGVCSFQSESYNRAGLSIGYPPSSSAQGR